ncbi:hypothetical protein QBC36DRAFT_23661 [Triangularia setosa]|uniref:GPI inositol-deacylase n=1 Tax=Triangularia setosa TaxID=2587417 RepID=A0AAN6W5B0_9PEZI|nr:hypothetical protein QBC36DRAFT_23661 [Podospora setosa]
MDQPRKTSFGGFLSRTGTDKPSSKGLGRASTTSSLSLWTTSVELADDEKGVLGLTTLHEPEPLTSPIADIVFVHGLGGGSRKTWSYSPDPTHYWPRAWLPADADFSHVRIHTFGYKADWGERKQSVLDIHGFGQTLLGALRNDPGIRRTGTRIILVGHSMGGCVAKKAYILARQDPTAADLASRVHSIFFLGTPHRGSDMAAVLENMLAVAWGRKPFVTDLIPNSSALSAINDAFRHIAPDIRLWSFYETLPVKSAMNRIVVERHSATLGFHNEEIAAMDADHRHVCKFESPSDPNYKMLRNALLTAVDAIRSFRSETPPTDPSGSLSPLSLSRSALSLSHAEITALLRSFLGTRDSSEGDLVTLQVLKQPGSCQWFTDQLFFSAWKAGTAPGILWLIGRPAAGKSILASHVIEQLKSPNVFCSYFICQHSKTGNSTLSDCFRSLAYQMALQDNLARDALLQLAEDDVTWDKSDETIVWRRIFTTTLFKLPSIARHFWVVDGVDECSCFSSLFAKRFLAALPDELRFFATSRPLEDIERGLLSLGQKRVTIKMLSDTDTVQDMRLLLNTRLAELGRPDNPEDRERVCEKILSKSRGSFLWIRLVLKEFEDVWSDETMEAVLEEAPPDLFAFYRRMAESVTSDKRKVTLAKSILTWVALTSHPLTLQELRCAVKLGVGQTLQNAGKAIPDLCAQLVFVDKNDRVQMIHETVREFLLTQDLGDELSINKKQGHTLLGTLLLKYLCSGVLNSKFSKNQPTVGHSGGFGKLATTSQALDLSMIEYSCRFFSDHLFRSASSDDYLMDALCNFLRNNTVLDWIEQVSAAGDLAVITRTATNLREYVARRTKYVPPTDRGIQLVDGWVTDLIRVTAKFRNQLLTCPSSIHFLIPPLCPSDSFISRRVSRESGHQPAPTGIMVQGIPPGLWDDCLIQIDFRNGQTTATTHGERYFAVGLSTGQILLYDPTSLQCLRYINHPERVRILAFSIGDVLLASCGAKHLVVWESRSGSMRHSFPLISPPLAMIFLGVDEIVLAQQSSILTKWNLQTQENDSIYWKDVGTHSDYNPFLQTVVPTQAPSRAAFLVTPDDVLVAIGYRSHPILIMSILEFRLVGICDTTFDNNGVNDLLFNPNPEFPALVASFQDGSLCVFDYTTQELHLRRAQVHAQSLACSPDGRSLGAGTNQGAVEVYEFERDHHGVTTTLVPVYRTNHPLDQTIRGICFSSDGIRFVDIRGKKGRVWAPASLVRKNMNELESSVDSSEAETAQAFGSKAPSGMMLHTHEHPEITSPVVASSDGSLVIAGKRDGSVVVLSTAEASEIGVLYRHGSGSAVIDIALSASQQTLASVDDAARILVVNFEAPLAVISVHKQLQQGTVLLDRRYQEAVTQILLSSAADRLLVSGRSSAQMWDVISGTIYLAGGETVAAAIGLTPGNSAALTCPVSPALPAPGPGALTVTHRAVFQHPNTAWFVFLWGDLLRIYSWSNFSELTPVHGKRLERPHENSSASGEVADHFAMSTPFNHRPTIKASYHVGNGFVLELLRPSLGASPQLHLWSASSLDPFSAEDTIKPANEANLSRISPNVLSVLGLVGASTLLFLDTSLWVCSTSLQSVTTTTHLPTGAEFQPRGFASRNQTTSRTRATFGSSTPSAWSSSSTLRAMTPAAHARRHFFALGEWRTAAGEFRVTIIVPKHTQPSGRMANGSTAGGRDVGIAFVNGHRLVVINGGFGFSESVAVTTPATTRLISQDIWRVTTGSMHRRAYHW